MSMELMEALNILEKEKDISKDTLLEAIEQSLLLACKNHFGKADNVTVHINPETCDFKVYAEKEVVEQVEDPVMEISLGDARKRNGNVQIGDTVRIEIHSKEFGRIATQNAKNVILQKIREEERKVLFDQYYSKEKDVVTGIVQRYFGKHVSVNLGKVDAILTEGEQIKGERFAPTERIKVYIVAVKDTTKGPKILVSRTHPELVKRLFESEVTEVREGIVEIKSIAREAGSRSKIAVWSNDPDVDPVGACVGMNGARVNAIVDELRGEKIDIINWSENPALLIENALSPAKVIAVYADPDEKTALVVVPDYQLSLAIGREGQNARLAAHLTGYKIDIKSETQARESGELYDYEEEEDYEELDGSEEEAAADRIEDSITALEEGEDLAYVAAEEPETEEGSQSEETSDGEILKEGLQDVISTEEEDQDERTPDGEIVGEEFPGEKPAGEEFLNEEIPDEETPEAIQSEDLPDGGYQEEDLPDEGAAEEQPREEGPTEETSQDEASPEEVFPVSEEEQYLEDAKKAAAQIYSDPDEDLYAGALEDLDDEEYDDEEGFDPESDFADLAFLELEEGDL